MAKDFMLRRPVAHPRLLTFAKFSVKATGSSAVLLRTPDAIVAGRKNARVAASGWALAICFIGGRANVDEQ